MSLTEKILAELKIQPKGILGNGTEHNVYPSLTQADVVIKTSKHGQYGLDSLKKFVDAYRQCPSLIAKVIKQTPTYLVVEKLDTERIEKENKEMYYFLKRLAFDIPSLRTEEQLKGDEAFYFLVLACKGKTATSYETLNKAISSGPLASVWAKWLPTIMKGIEYKHTYDMHSGNVGYSKDGTLKLLDI